MKPMAITMAIGNAADGLTYGGAPAGASAMAAPMLSIDQCFCACAHKPANRGKKK